MEHRAFHEFSLAYTRKVVAALKRESDGRRVPVIVFTKGGGLWLEQLAGAGADVVGLDWTCDLGAARRRTDDAGWRCKATSIQWCCSQALTRWQPRRGPCLTATAHRSAPMVAGVAMLISGPWHPSTHPARACAGARRSGPHALAPAADAGLTLISKKPPPSRE